MDAATIDVASATAAKRDVDLEFLWLELTNRCNLQCIHCYTASHPRSGDRDLLTTEDYESVMSQAHALGCRRIQFIGGEPLLNRDFLRLLRNATALGFEFIEVFSNLTRLDNETVRFAAETGVRFATSVYSDDRGVHNAVTRVGSSHTRTVTNLCRLIDAGVRTRASVIVIDQDQAAVERTKEFLRDRGVGHVRDSEVREFGRGEEILAQPARLSGLCGHCWAGKLCVAPDGDAYPCVMARKWPVGDVLQAPLGDIVQGQRLAAMRGMIYETVWLRKLAASGGARGQVGEDDDQCGPDSYDEPGGPPDTEKPYPEPAVPAECPQSCVPDLSTPPVCPQSCNPFIAVCEPTEPTEPTQRRRGVTTSGRRRP